MPSPLQHPHPHSPHQVHDRHHNDGHQHDRHGLALLGAFCGVGVLWADTCIRTAPKFQLPVRAAGHFLLRVYGWYSSAEGNQVQKLRLHEKVKIPKSKEGLPGVIAALSSCFSDMLATILSAFGYVRRLMTSVAFDLLCG